MQTRRLAGEDTVVLMLFYTVGLTLLTSVPAVLVWIPISWVEAPSIILIGILAQVGQYCWLQAYQKQEARLLAPIGYLSIIFSGFAGWLYFGEVPSLSLGLCSRRPDHDTRNTSRAVAQEQGTEARPTLMFKASSLCQLLVRAGRLSWGA